MSSPNSQKLENELRQKLLAQQMKRSSSTIELMKELGSNDDVKDKRKSRWDSSESEDEDEGDSLPRSSKVLKVDSLVTESNESLAHQAVTNESMEPAGCLTPEDTPEGSADEAEDSEAMIDSDVGDLERTPPPGFNRLASATSLPNIATTECSSSTFIDNHNPLFSGCRNVDYFEKVRMVDEGSYGVVFAARNRITKELVALKKVKLTKDASNRDGFPITALRETNVLLALQHPNIVSVREMVVGKRMDEIFMVMEYFDNDLKRVLAAQRERNRKAREEMLGTISNKHEFNKEPVFKIREVKCFMQQMLSGMEFMHRCWYLHRDLKTANILYNSKGKLAICDFGLARKFGEPIKPYSTNIVTLYYRSPEILMGTKTYSTEVDMWSVGCIFAEILTGNYFFEGTSEVDQLSKIFQVLGQPSNARWPGYEDLPHSSMLKWKGLPRESRLRDKFPRPSSSFTDVNDMMSLTDSGFNLLEGLLTLDPAKRLSAHDALHHPWFSEEPLALPRDRMPVYPPAGSKESE